MMSSKSSAAVCGSCHAQHYQEWLQSGMPWVWLTAGAVSFSVAAFLRNVNLAVFKTRFQTDDS